MNATNTNRADTPQQRRLLLVDDYEEVLTTMGQILAEHGFDVTTANNVPDALRLCCSKKFDVLISDLQMPRPGDGFIVAGAMRHCNPEAITVIYSGYPALNAATSDILLQADEVLVKPVDIPELLNMIDQRLSHQRNHAPRAVPGDDSVSVSSMLHEQTFSIIADWLVRTKGSPELVCVEMSDADRMAHLPKLLLDISKRLLDRDPMHAPVSDPVSAQLHGEKRRLQGYSAALLVDESRMLQVSIFQALQQNLRAVDFTGILVSVMTIADEVDAHLKQAMDSFIAGSKVAAPQVDARMSA
ncbi:MAG TPA: response regulator [Terriglobales bacterium]|nr:response regulator [Terriglobales bacterium]